MKRTAKITSIILCLVMLLGSVLGVISSAAEPFTATAEITGKNVVYGEKMYMAIAIGATTGNTLPATVGVATYATADAATPIHVSTEIDKDEKGNSFYVTYGVSAKDIDTTYYYAVINTATGECLSEVLDYSVYRYAEERLTKDAADLTEKQTNLYNSIKAYAEAANKMEWGK